MHFSQDQRLSFRQLVSTLSPLGLWLCLVMALTAGKVSAQAMLPDFAELVAANSPTIVNITTRQQVPARSGADRDDLEELLRQLQPEEELDLPDLPTRPRGGVGSGFIMSEDGFIITNHHVVANADRITVTLNDRREFFAEVIGSDELSDVALLKIDPDNLHAVQFGNSDALRVGEWVLAIGSPFGLEFSAAAGIVSAKSRSVPSRGSTNYVSFIQTDVAINQGNSGGPLFNLEGQVVGINSQILSSTGGSNGISFAIPSNMALNVIEQLKESGSVSRGLLGVLIKDVNYGLAQAYGLDAPLGAFVDEVQPDSPAQRAGIENNDIVIAFNDIPINESSQLPYYVGQVRPGTEATITLLREGQQLDLPVVVGALPGSELAQGASPPSQPRGNTLALTVAPVMPEQAEGVAELSEGGVMIDELRQGPARQAGLSSGDIIVMLNHRSVTSLADFEAVVAELPETGYVPVRVIRNGRGSTLAIELQ